MHVIDSEPFYKKLIHWNPPPSSWKHPWLTAPVTGKACARLQYTLMVFFSPATSSLLLTVQTLLYTVLAVCCIHIKD